MTPESAESEQENSRVDLYLLFSMLFLILAHPALDEVFWGRIVLGLLTFVPLVVALVRMSGRTELVWPFGVLLAVAFVCALVHYFTGNHWAHALQWALLSLSCGIAVYGLFGYLQKAVRVSAGHLYTAGSIYLLLILFFFCLYTTVSELMPGSFEKTSGGSTSQAVDLLYFSMVTLTTVGYGDIVPVRGLVRMLAGLEAAVGVLYVAITVAILVSGYKAKAR